MTFFNQLSLNKKISLAISILCAGLLIVVVVCLVNLHSLRDSIDLVGRNMSRRVALVTEIRDLQRQMIITERAALLMSKAEDIQRLKKARQELLVKSNSNFDEFLKMASEEGRIIAKQYRESLNKYWDLSVKVIELYESGRQKEAIDIILGEEGAIREEGLGQLKTLVELTNKKMNEAIEEADGAYARTKLQLIVASLLASTLGITLSWMILRALSKSMNQVISELESAAIQVTSASRQVASSSEQLSQSTTEQAASIEETASAVDQMTSTIQKNADYSKTAAEESDKSRQTAARGQDATREVIRAIEEINLSNQKIAEQTERTNQGLSAIIQVIGEIDAKTSVINDIVFQTKLLSFNASVEAARAGEQGKGFAVVAEEVGNLATMSGTAAREISAMLDASIKKVQSIVEENRANFAALIAEGQAKVARGNEVARACGEALTEIVATVSSSAQLSGEISTATKEQSVGVNEIANAMRSLEQATQENAAASEQAAQVAEELSAQADAMMRSVHSLNQVIRGAGADSSAVVESRPTAASAAKAATQKKSDGGTSTSEAA